MTEKAFAGRKNWSFFLKFQDSPNYVVICPECSWFFGATQTDSVTGKIRKNGSFVEGEGKMYICVQCPSGHIVPVHTQENPNVILSTTRAFKNYENGKLVFSPW